MSPLSFSSDIPGNATPILAVSVNAADNPRCWRPATVDMTSGSPVVTAIGHCFQYGHSQDCRSFRQILYATVIPGTYNAGFSYDRRVSN
jgi:hypothetical protein